MNVDDAYFALSRSGRGCDELEVRRGDTYDDNKNITFLNQGIPNSTSTFALYHSFLLSLDMPPSPSPPAYITYRIARGETSVFSSAPPYAHYKAVLLPLWRFRTPSTARTSAAAIYAQFLAYDADDDFVGMDMCRKYLQMGMTRAKRYANYSGGRKYVNVKAEDEGDGHDVKEGGKGSQKVQKVKSEGHKGKEEKEEASRIFREVWEKCKAHEGYMEKKRVFLKEQKAWDREQAKLKALKEERTVERRGTIETEIKDEVG